MSRINQCITNSFGVVYKLNQNFEDCIHIAVKHIQHGNVIAIPTDTIYGLAADVQNNDAIKKLYTIKGRTFMKPLSICVRDVNNIKNWGYVDHLPVQILEQLLPGPVTVVLNRTPNLNSSFNHNIKKVGIRVPKNDFVQKLTSFLDTPIALTSANKSNETSSVSIDEFSSFWNELNAIFDNGSIGKNRSGSTIIDLSEPGKYEIIRKGNYYSNTVQILKKFDFREK
ncbi:hypothetical protein PGB90_000905 [Kerria lacca]